MKFSARGFAIKVKSTNQWAVTTAAARGAMMRTAVACAGLALMLGLLGPGTGTRVRAQGAPAGGFQWQAQGEKTYDTLCSGCHQRSGRGLAGAFPPLVGHAPEVLGRPDGRAYIARLVLFGLTGAIEVNGNTYDGVMPSWATLGDDEVAAVINHVLHAWGNDAKLPKDFTPILPAEIAAARADGLTQEQVHALREHASAAAGAGAAAQIEPSFSQDQADRGQAAYAHSCLDCHGSTLDNGEFGGPPLKGSSFTAHWSAANVAALVSFMKARMPLDRPGSLTDETYADLTAYILSQNGYRAGDKELTTDATVQQAMSLRK
jgi:mono/diheme cytochrome c family protein